MFVARSHNCQLVTAKQRVLRAVSLVVGGGIADSAAIVCSSSVVTKTVIKVGPFYERSEARLLITCESQLFYETDAV